MKILHLNLRQFLFKLFYISFAVFFIFLLNPYNLFSQKLVYWILCITGVLILASASRIFEILLNKIISLQQENNKLKNEDNELIVYLEKENSELKEQLDLFKLPGELIKVPKQVLIDFKFQVDLSQEQNKDLRLQLEDLSYSYKKVTDENRVLCNSNNWLRIGLTGITSDNFESPHGALK